MINFNGTLTESNIQISTINRSFLYGDSVFETLKIADNKILFFEEHYFRLMASMRIVRMEIPMKFTIEFLESQILELTTRKGIADSARVRMTVFRNEGGFYTPETNSISYVIEASPIETKAYTTNNDFYEVDLFKDFVTTKHLLSSLKTGNKMIQVTAGIYARENDLDSCLLINEDKNVVEAFNGNLFMLTAGKLVTPPITEGCLNGIMRKQILKLAKEIADLEVLEAIISPFELQKADELFITNVIMGVQSITKYRKKEFSSVFANQLVNKLNEQLELI